MANIVPQQPIEYRKQRILTTEQLAAAYGTSPNTLLKNFQRHKKDFLPGRHFFVLDGVEKKAFCKLYQVTSHATNFYLWTEKGAWMYAEHLGTDEARKAYQGLVESYYQLKELLEKQAKQPEPLKIGPEPQWTTTPAIHIKMQLVDGGRTDEIRDMIEQYLIHMNKPMSIKQMRDSCEAFKAIPLGLFREQIEEMELYGTIEIAENIKGSKADHYQIPEEFRPTTKAITIL